MRSSGHHEVDARVDSIPYPVSVHENDLSERLEAAYDDVRCDGAWSDFVGGARDADVGLHHETAVDDGVSDSEDSLYTHTQTGFA